MLRLRRISVFILRRVLQLRILSFCAVYTHVYQGVMFICRRKTTFMLCYSDYGVDTTKSSA